MHPADYAAPTPGEQHRIAGDTDPSPYDETQATALRQEPPDPDLPAPERSAVMTLADLVEVGLRNSPVTRQSWAKTRASAANWGRARSSYYPQIDGEVQGGAGEFGALQPGNRMLQTSATLSYLLLDFGGRAAKAEGAHQALLAANWSHNQTVQDLLRDVPQSYYTLLGDKAQVRATERSLAEAETTLRSTEERHRNGVATIADVLQARASAAQVRVQLATNRGSVEIARGALATVVGWPANTPLEIAGSLDRAPVQRIAESVDSLVEEATLARPELEAVRAAVRRKEAAVVEARAMPFPTLTGGGTASWQYINANNALYSNNNTSYYGTLTLSIPIFHGFDMQSALTAARMDLDAARAMLKQQEEAIVKEVWDAYQNFNTAKQQLTASRELLTSAQESYDASLARYRAGAADIVELLNAQSLLANARSELINAQTGLFVSYAELLHAVGSTLAEGPLPSTSIEEKDIAYETD